MNKEGVLYQAFQEEKILEELLLEWVNRLKELQFVDCQENFDGGLACPNCTGIHGRSIDAFLPFLWAAKKTGDDSYLKAAEALFDWTEKNVLCEDQGLINDSNNDWQGVTIFTVIHLTESYRHYHQLLPEELRRRLLARITDSMSFIDGYLPTLETNVNYYFGGALVYAQVGKLLRNEAYLTKARQWMDTCLTYFDETGLLFGEGRPADVRTPKGQRAIDLGYNVEESLPAMVQYALLMEDESVLEKARQALKVHGHFAMTDGGWDNSWGTRNVKWSYWGSRTSDSCQLAYGYFPDEPDFQTIAWRNLELLRHCTQDGLLTGGPMYQESGEKICVHHTICHAKALALCLTHGITLQPGPPTQLPVVAAIASWNQGQVATLRNQAFYASVLCGDYQYYPGTTAAGGSIGLLYGEGWGLIMAATTLDYRLSEPTNLQVPQHWRVQSQTLALQPRSRYFKSSAYSEAAELECYEDRVVVSGDYPDDGAGWRTQSRFQLQYGLDAGGFTIKVDSAQPAELCLPLITGQAGELVLTASGCFLEKAGKRLKIEIDSGDLAAVKITKEKFFHPVGGFIYQQLLIPVTKKMTLVFRPVGEKQEGKGNEEKIVDICGIV